MIDIKLNPLNASKFFEKLPPKVSTVNNFKQPKTGLNHINGGEAFNREVTGKITQKIAPSIGPIKKTIGPTSSNIPEVGNNPKTEPFNGLVPGRTDRNINWKKIVIYSVSALAIGVAGYFAYQKLKKKDEENRK